MIKKMPFKVIICLFAVSLSYVSQLHATEKKWGINALIWKSTGETNWNHDASMRSSLVGNPTSELSYENVNSDILELGISYQANQKSFFRFKFGVGTVDSGLLIDDDYLSAEGAAKYGTTQQGTHRFSRTHSDVSDDSLSYFQLELGYSAKKVPDRYSLELRAGYEQWREQYEAYGLTQIECTGSDLPEPLCAPVGFSGFYNTKVITNEVTWKSIYFGLDGSINVTTKILMSGVIILHPFADMENEDIHHLRANELGQNPSFAMSGDGLGYNFEARLGYVFSKQGSLSILYRYWHREVNDGTWTVYGPNGEVGFAKLNKLESTRKGPAMEFYYSF